MSYSVSYIGNPDKIINALKEYGNTISGQSKQEFNKALRHVIELIKQNDSKPGPLPIIEVSMSGSKTVYGADKLHSSCHVSIKHIYGVIV